MTLRTKLITWFIVLHIALAASAIAFFQQNRILLFALEAGLVLSMSVSWALVRALFVPLGLISTGADLISERDFTSRFVPTGQPEMDRLVEIYNRMIDRLREERVAAEEQHQLLERLVQASPSGIVICDFEGGIQQTNPAAELLMQNQPLSEVLPDMASGESRLVALGSRRLKIWRTEFRDRGFPKAFYLLEELTEELRLTEKAAYEKLIRMMSHEVNNSVGSVRSLLESLLRYRDQVSEPDRADFQTAVTVASARMETLNRFMSGFADVVRIPPPAPSPTSVKQMIEEIATLLRPELERREIRLTFDLPAENFVNVDRHQFEQVILNLLRNAIESIGKKGTIEITWRDHTLTIADSGAGIAEASLREIFTPFFTTKRDGRGLGLTIVQEILSGHQLPFTLENRVEGGAAFRIVFPATD